jgi:CubicO group peptidase (beta-lactamase class C family)
VKNVTAKTSDKFLYGSTTKMTTAVAVMQLVELGVVSLEEPMAPIVDRFIARTVAKTNYTWRSLVDLFGSNVSNVTVRHLLNMHSGIADYDNGGLRGFQNANPLVDIAPLDILNMCPKNLTCFPGTCGSYSSTNYVILGLVLAELHNALDWDEYDQRSIFQNQANGKKATSTNEMIFPDHGPCRLSHTAHGYQQPPPNYYDVYNMSCLGGWTCGNMAAPVQSVADFVYDLYGPPTAYVNDTSIKEMTQFTYLDTGDFPAWYGIGTMLLKFHWDENKTYHMDFVGHGGATYGFYSMSGYNYQHGFSLVLATNMEYPIFQENLFDIHSAIYNQTLAVMAKHNATPALA